MNPEQTDDRRTPMTDELLVTQEDREAAADVWRDYIAKVGEVMVEKGIRDGSLDHGSLVQAFARHRIAQAKADAARIEALEEALRFYARPQSWRSSGVYMSGRSQATAAEIDGGERARAALETTP